jgi:hypothetical protein
MELDCFLGQNQANVCLSTEMQLRSGEDFQMAIHFCPHTSRLTERVGTVIVVRRRIDHYLVVASHPIHFLLESISDPDNLPLQACVDVIRRLLTCLTLRTGAACTRADVKTVAPLCTNIAAQPRRTLAWYSPASCLRKKFAAGRSNFSTPSANTASIYAS